MWTLFIILILEIDLACHYKPWCYLYTTAQGGSMWGVKSAVTEVWKQGRWIRKKPNQLFLQRGDIKISKLHIDTYSNSIICTAKNLIWLIQHNACARTETHPDSEITKGLFNGQQAILYTKTGRGNENFYTSSVPLIPSAWHWEVVESPWFEIF